MLPIEANNLIDPREKQDDENLTVSSDSQDQENEQELNDDELLADDDLDESDDEE